MFNITKYLSNIDHKLFFGKAPDMDLVLSTDSRSIKGSCIFLGLSGPNFKGADFAEDAFKKGALCAVINDGEKSAQELELIKKEWPDRSVILCQDSLKFLQVLGNAHRNAWCGTIIGLTGSNGKTTTKEMLQHFFKSIVGDKVLCTEGNLNNHIGVPLTLLRIQDVHDFCIVEMGSNSPGEIRLLCEIAEPDHGIITSIGEAHLEFFKDLEGVLNEKRSLFDYVVRKESSLFVVNKDDLYLEKMLLNTKSKGQVITFGKSGDVSIAYQQDSIKLENKTLTNPNLLGKHNFSNFISAYLLVRGIFPDNEENLDEAFRHFAPGLGRSQWKKWNNLEVFEDAYNANPTSMRVSLEAFFDYCSGKEISLDKLKVVVGDMNEVGSGTDKAHQDMGKYLLECGVTNPIFVGRYHGGFVKGFGDQCLVYESVDQLKKEFLEKLQDATHIFLKASRSVQLEKLLD